MIFSRLVSLRLTIINGCAQVFTNYGSGGGFSPTPTVVSLSSLGVSRLLAIAGADVDGDGLIDLLACDEKTAGLIVAFRKGDGSYRPSKATFRTNGMEACTAIGGPLISIHQEGHMTA